jgi:hypothetical protein
MCNPYDSGRVERWGVRDPLEGVTADGRIRTGASPQRIVAEFTPVLDAAVELLGTTEPNTSLYVYGSVATAQARPQTSDVDLLTIDLPADEVADVSHDLSTRFAGTCRAVEIAPAMASDLERTDDEAYGFSVFLHHYCVHLVGVDHDRATAAFVADRRAARGFNGDIALHLQRWRRAVATDDAAVLARRVARKTLLAVAGLVSIHDRTWTTDRALAADQWAEVEPRLGDGLTELLGWADGITVGTRADVARALDATVTPIVAAFAHTIGLWRSDT